MKEWALENGATHFTHWFQSQRVLAPLRNTIHL
ncbi:glutamine synthetase III [Candidatus Endomicrobiellum trichonymphae]